MLGPTLFLLSIEYYIRLKYARDLIVPDLFCLLLLHDSVLKVRSERNARFKEMISFFLNVYSLINLI